jgi:hypothetical protein
MAMVDSSIDSSDLIELIHEGLVGNTHTVGNEVGNEEGNGSKQEQAQEQEAKEDATEEAKKEAKKEATEEDTQKTSHSIVAWFVPNPRVEQSVSFSLLNAAKKEQLKCEIVWTPTGMGSVHIHLPSLSTPFTHPVLSHLVNGTVVLLWLVVVVVVMLNFFLFFLFFLVGLVVLGFVVGWEQALCRISQFNCGWMLKTKVFFRCTWTACHCCPR